MILTIRSTPIILAGFVLWATCGCTRVGETDVDVDLIGDSASIGTVVYVDGTRYATLATRRMAASDMPLIADAVTRDSSVVREWLYRRGEWYVTGGKGRLRAGPHQVMVVTRRGDVMRDSADMRDYTAICVSGRLKMMRTVIIASK